MQGEADHQNMQMIAEREKYGKIDVYKGKARLWSVLDESYNEEQINKTQLNVNDPNMVKSISGDSLSLEKNRNIAERREEEDIISSPTKTEYYQ